MYANVNANLFILKEAPISNIWNSVLLKLRQLGHKLLFDVVPNSSKNLYCVSYTLVKKVSQHFQ